VAYRSETGYEQRGPFLLAPNAGTNTPPTDFLTDYYRTQYSARTSSFGPDH
jgi:hypothetical protein